MALDTLLKVTQLSSTDFCCDTNGNLTLKLRDVENVTVCQDAPSLEVSHDGTAPINITLPVTGTQTINMDGSRLFINGFLQNSNSLTSAGITVTQPSPSVVNITSTLPLPSGSAQDPCIIQIFYQVCDTLGNLQPNPVTC